MWYVPIQNVKFWSLPYYISLSLSYKVDTKLTSHNTLVARECLIHGFNSSSYASKSIQFRNCSTKKYPIAMNQQIFFPKKIFLFQLFCMLHYSVTHFLTTKTFAMFQVTTGFRDSISCTS